MTGPDSGGCGMDHPCPNGQHTAPAVPDNGGLREAEELWSDLINEDDQGAVDRVAALLAERDEAVRQVAAVRELAGTWEARARTYSEYDDRDKVTHLRQSVSALRRALGDAL